jgi:hypothetical protein
MTASIFSKSPLYWYQDNHAGRPYNYMGYALFVDLNGDGYLDYFNSMHGLRILNKDGTIANLDGRIEMALSIPSEDGKIALESIADRIIYEDHVDA